MWEQGQEFLLRWKASFQWSAHQVCQAGLAPSEKKQGRHLAVHRNDTSITRSQDRWASGRLVQPKTGCSSAPLTSSSPTIGGSSLLSIHTHLLSLPPSSLSLVRFSFLFFFLVVWYHLLPSSSLRIRPAEPFLASHSPLISRPFLCAPSSRTGHHPTLDLLTSQAQTH